MSMSQRQHIDNEVDPAALQNYAQVLRLAGFFHCKRERFLCA
jgi:hypothetical protein